MSSGGAPTSTNPRRTDRGPKPLSFSQERLFLLDRTIECADDLAQPLAEAKAV